VTRDILGKDPLVERIAPMLERLRDTSRGTDTGVREGVASANA